MDRVRHRSPATDSSRTSSPSRCRSPATVANTNSSSNSSRPQSTVINSSSNSSRPHSDLLQNYRIESSPRSPSKRNSTPVHTGNNNNSSFSFFRSSIDNSTNSGKSKGSPVTALKDAIDKSFFTNGEVDPSEILSAHGIPTQDSEGYLQPNRNSSYSSSPSFSNFSYNEEKVRWC